MINVIATDIDGTFFSDDDQFDRLGFQAQLAEMNHRQMHFIAASSNHLDHLVKIFADFNGPISYVANNGGHVVNEQVQTIAEQPVSSKQWHQIVAWLTQQGQLPAARIILIGEHGTYTEVPASDQFFQAVGYFYDDLQSIANINAVSDKVYKLDITCGDFNIAPIYQGLQQQFGHQVNVVMSGLNGIDIMANGVSKLSGIEVLLNTWQLPLAQVAAFGDNDNDYEMLTGVGHGLAMKNAAPNLLKRYPHLTKWDNNHDGVTRSISDILRNQEH